jgi:hypothetical protein
MAAISLVATLILTAETWIIVAIVAIVAMWVTAVVVVIEAKSDG